MMRHTLILALLALATLLPGACDCGGPPAEDAGPGKDATVAVDASGADSAEVDAGGADAVTPDATTVDAAGCTAGHESCRCLPGAACASSELYCGDGVCRRPACRVGELGCACDVDFTCGQSDDDSWLLCEAGLCRRPSCPAGSVGCACTSSHGCDPGLSCVADAQGERCQIDDCPVGDLGCACYRERTCNPDPSGVALACDANQCVRSACAPGSEGCLCRADYSCGSGMICRDGARCEVLRCTPGSASCECLPGGYCNSPTLVCEASSSQCVEQACDPGTDGCSCLSDGTCGLSSAGTALVCAGDRCVAPSCTPGSLGCACTAQGSCASASAICTAGWCMATSCTAGGTNCTCGGSGTCDVGLACLNGDICVDDTGYVGGVCLPNGSCRAGGRCVSGLCVPCLGGSLGCSCESGWCQTGLACLAGACVSQQSLARSRPANPRCYTPCKADLLRSDNTLARCSSQGLLDGCIGDNVCTEGSCVPRTVSPFWNTGSTAVPFCASELDCPDFQTCIEGHCYSDCERDGDCAPGLACSRKVCRSPCLAGGDECPDGMYCEVGSGGNAGFCSALGTTLDTETSVEGGSFTLSSPALSFSPVLVDGAFRVFNRSHNMREFHVQKKFHGLYDASGAVLARVDEFRTTCDWSNPDPDICPLSWLELSVDNGATTTDGDLAFELAGNCPDLPACGDNDVCPAGMSCGQGLCFCDDASCGDAWSCTATVHVGAIADRPGTAARVSGVLEINGQGLGAQRVSLSYRESQAGQWKGTMYSFANFGDQNMDLWLQSDRSDDTKLEGVENAFLKRWVNFRRGINGLVTLDEFEAMLNATLTESWRWPSVKQACQQQYATENCYLTQQGPVVYSNDNIRNPVPSGVVDMPFAVNLRPDPDNNHALTGKVESRLTLQYAGGPGLTLEFADAPGTCSANSRPESCTSVVLAMRSPSQSGNQGVDIRVGGRYLTGESDATCSRRTNFEQASVPWLVPGFVAPGFVYADAAQRLGAPPYSYECRDTLLPFYPANPSQLTALKPLNTSMSSANVVPDGRTRQRRLELIDGFMVNGRDLYLLVRETFSVPTSGITERSFAGYSLIALRRAPATLETADANQNGVADVFDGADYSADIRPTPTDDLLSSACSAAVIGPIPGINQVTNGNAGTVAMTILDGIKPGGTLQQVYPRGAYTGPWEPHYWCEDTGLLDGGIADKGLNGTPISPNTDTCSETQDSRGRTVKPNNGWCEDGGPGSVSDGCALATDATDCGLRYFGDFREPCPGGSRVVYFLLNKDTAGDQNWVANTPCQIDESMSCWDVLLHWVATGSAVLDPPWTCADPDQVLCSGNRVDLRSQKKFYLASGSPAAVFEPLDSVIESGFRYKTRFQSRGGQSLGFAPDLCDTASDSIPYCYDPASIETVQQRVDCLVDIYKNRYDNLTVDQQGKLKAFLTRDLAYDTTSGRDGFERLNAELLIMLGDEMYTRAFSSRFDLAQTRMRSFEGSAFEAGGINLSGGAGDEMYSLYLAVQYDQMVLDRFNRLGPALWASLDGSADRRFVTQETVSSYLVKVARASTQKSKAMSEIAARYQGFNRSDLARRVVERAYTATYLESILIGRMMDALMDTLAPDDKPQVALLKEEIARSYRVAMSDMRNVYLQITDEITYFGFAPDYVPFPALDNVFLTNNAFEVLYDAAAEKVDLAAEREATALADNRDFETDSQAFQRELVTLRTSYNSQLGDLCGTFVGDDGGVYAATSDNASHNEAAARYGDPCGLIGNGALFQAMGDVDLKGLDLQAVIGTQEKITEQIKIEMQRVADYCDEVRETVDFEYQQAGAKIALNTLIGITQGTIEEARNVYEMTRDFGDATKCNVGTATDCWQVPVAVASLTVAGGVLLTAEIIGKAAILAMQEGIEGIDRTTARFVGMQQCDYAQVDSQATVMNLVLDLLGTDVDRVRAEYEIKLALSEVQRLRNQATALQAEMKEQEQLLINVEAARNDPNVRIYRNDAILNADVAFKDALAAVYKATKIYEYYTSQSYGDLDKLFLVRMVAAGDYNLQNYLIQLGNAFSDFLEQYGNPDTRVEIYSLRDDILGIPRTGEDLRPLTEAQRIALFRAKLQDGSLLDPQGYLVAPFATSFRKLSPLTRNHKVLSTEVELDGEGVGDEVARVYVRQQGTSTVRTVADDKLYFQFPPRTAVINTFMNGERIFGDPLYTSYRLRDRPFVNSAWALVFNQQDEVNNLDVDLNDIDDIRLLVYYTDFTAY
ncbi:MAG: hypothetical protein ABIJ09_18360 [Pseudomonadota bacterium]